MFQKLAFIPRNFLLKKYFVIYSGWIFLLLFIIISLIYQFDDILFMRPQAVHQWRQCDCLSFANNYYHNDANFFSPRLHFCAGDGTGKTVSDFPLIYFTVAQLWKVFGYHEYIYRLVVLLLSFAGLLALMKTIEDILKDSFLAIFISLLMYSSTILVYYSNNFLMNVPSFSMALLALSFFYKFYKTGKNIHLHLSIFFYLIGGLLKIPALTSFMAILGLYIMEQLGMIRLKGEKKLFNRPAIQLFPFALLIILISAWYIYAYYYNKAHNSGIFLIGILPIWELSWDKIVEIYDHARILWFESYHSAYIQYLLVIFLILIFSFRKKINKTLFLMTTLLFIGFIMFIALWFNVFNQHDYYLINQLVFMISIFVSFFYLLKYNYPKLINNKWVRLLLIILLAHNVYLCRNNINARYYGWPNDGHMANTKALETITPYLRSLNIDRDDKVLFMKDGSFNISLYLMDQKGYTADDYFADEVIKDRISKVKYLLLNDTTLLQRNYIQTAINKQIGEYQNILIFSLKSD